MNSLEISLEAKLSNLEKIYHHSSHWGAFDAVVEDGKLTRVKPFKNDPSPSPILNSIPNAIYGKTRVSTPMVRSGWLEKGPEKSKAKRGEDGKVMNLRE